MDDLISRQAAISLPPKPKEDRYFQTQNLDDAYDYGWCDLQRCIEKLPTAQPEQKTGTWIAVDYSIQPEQTNCDYCHEDVDGYVKPIEKNGHAFVRFDMDGWELSLKANGWHGSAKIRYCPMCGRDLLVKLGRKAGENE